MLQYARSITFPKASGKAGYIGKLPCGGFSKDCELERTNRLCRAGGNIISIGTVPPDFRRQAILLLVILFAFLIGNAAAGFASGLAGSLALTAAAVFCAFAEIAGFQRFNSLHGL